MTTDEIVLKETDDPPQNCGLVAAAASAVVPAAAEAVFYAWPHLKEWMTSATSSSARERIWKKNLSENKDLRQTIFQSHSRREKKNKAIAINDEKDGLFEANMKLSSVVLFLYKYLNEHPKGKRSRYEEEKQIQLLTSLVGLIDHFSFELKKK